MIIQPLPPVQPVFISVHISGPKSHTGKPYGTVATKQHLFFLFFFFCKQALLNFGFSASKTEDDTETKADGGEDKDESNKVSSSLEA